MSRKYGRYTRYQGGFGESTKNSKFKIQDMKVFQNAAIMKTKPQDSSYRVEVYPAYLSSTLEKHSIGTVKISTEKIVEIDELLGKLDPISIVPFEEMKNSEFKQNFLEKRLGDMEQKVDFFMEKIERQTEVDHLLFAENNEKYGNEDFMRMYDKRRRLPAFENRNQIVKLIEDHQVVLISGDTGCGKTTQVPQFLLDEYINGYKGSVCKIICTQPRRISAISVAERVAAERAEPLGISCGYQIRMEKVLPRKFGSILYVTNGIVIRHMETDPSLNNISHLILDEIHEQDVHSDFLLALIKQLIKKRKDLKVILMSATLNEKQFRDFFNNCPHVVIRGLAHPIDEYYLEDVVNMLNFTFPPSAVQSESSQYNANMFVTKVIPYVNMLDGGGQYSHRTCMELSKPQSEELNLDLIYRLTLHICENEEEGAILIFVTGYDDIKKLWDLFGDFPEDQYIFAALHSQIPMEEQKIVFDEAPPGVRKIIISTNIAETSVTIDDVVFVIDCGWVKIKKYDARTKTENLEARFISKANAVQRKGRAGRLRAGKCYRLYTYARFEAFYAFQKPEILRVRLESLILQTKLLQLGKVEYFFSKLLNQPIPEIVRFSLELLNQLGALDEDEALTPLGYYLAKLPISPQLGKMLIFGVFFSCLDPILNIAVGLDYKSPFNLNLRKNNQGDEKLLEFAEGVKSDHLLLHKALTLYQNVSKDARQEFCRACNLNYEVMEVLRKMKKEFMDNLLNLQLVTNENSKSKEVNLYSNNIELIKSLVCAGLFPNIIVAYPTVPRIIFQTVDGKKVILHKKSILAADRFFSCPLLTYYIKLKTRMDMVHDATICSPFAIILFGDNLRVEKSLNANYITVGNMKFSSDKDVATIMESLNNRLAQYLQYRLLYPASSIEISCNENEVKFLRTIVDLLASPEG